MKAHSILGHLSILVAGGQVTQGTDCWLCDVLSVAGPKHCSHQSLNASNLHKMRSISGLRVIRQQTESKYTIYFHRDTY